MQIFKEKRLIFQVEKGPGRKAGAYEDKASESVKENREKGGKKPRNGAKKSLKKAGDDMGKVIATPEKPSNEKEWKTPDPKEIMKRMGYDSVEPFVDGVAVAGKDGFYSLINGDGSRISQIYFEIKDFSEGLAWASTDEKWLLINKDGKEVGDGLYDDAQMFSEGKAGVKVGSKWHFIDKSGKKLEFGEFDEVYPFYGGIAGVRIGRYWKFIKKDGSRLNDKNYDAVEDFDMSDGTVNGRRNGRWITINRRGEEIRSSNPVKKE